MSIPRPPSTLNLWVFRVMFFLGRFCKYLNPFSLSQCRPSSFLYKFICHSFAFILVLFKQMNVKVWRNLSLNNLLLQRWLTKLLTELRYSTVFIQQLTRNTQVSNTGISCFYATSILITQLNVTKLYTEPDGSRGHLKLSFIWIPF